MLNPIRSYLLLCLMIIIGTPVASQSSLILSPDGFVKIEQGSGGFFATLDPGDRFSRDHDAAGDINGDGTIDLVVGARSDDDGATDAGAVYILFMNSDGTVQSHQKISMLEGGFTDTLNAGNFFGYGVAGIGDYDGDGIPDIAASAPVPPNRALYIIFLNANGTVKSLVKNSNITAQGLSTIGDLNGDGRSDLVACDPGSDIGGTDIGAIRILFLDSTGHVLYPQSVLIGPNSGGFGSGLVPGDQFGGREVARLGDLDNDGSPELAVGSFMADSGRGAIWILSLDPATFQVVSKLKIAQGLAGFPDTLTTGSNPNGTTGANFGHALCAAGDLDGDGVVDIMTGANQQNEGWGYILYMNPDKTVKSVVRFNNTEGGFGLVLDPEERFSRSISFIGDLRGDGSIAVNYGGGAGGTGALYLLFFQPCVISQNPGFNFYTGGGVLFTNWSHLQQALISDSLSFIQCIWKGFEVNAPFVTFNPSDGRCICKDSSASLASSIDQTISYTNGCHPVVTTGIGAYHFESGIHLFPNPVDFELTLKGLSNGNGEAVDVELVDLSGRLVFARRFFSSSAVIPMNEFHSGFYLLRIATDEAVSTFRVVKN